MEQLFVNASLSSYPVYIGEGIRSRTGELLLSEAKGADKVFVITDSAVGPLYLEDVVQSFPDHVEIFTFTVESGEASKSFAEYERILTAMLESGLDRKSVVTALGGGVVGDLAGFAAATYMRGIPFVQMPTTLLAHDSSVGGKTGINHPLGKNMIGAFHQPSAVIYDVEMLQTLPDKEWRSGFAEMMKHAYIKDASFLEWLQRHITTIEDVKTSAVSMLKRSIQVKADVVALDERETGVRAHLNFGHTLGHAVENTAGYGKWAHGEAVAAGMLFAMQLSNEEGLSAWDTKKEKEWLLSLGYPLVMTELSADSLLRAMKKDKKTSAGVFTFVLVTEPGETITKQIPDETVHRLLESFIERGRSDD
ncbi:3-dehydroquinate synthase [Sinobaca qinghaiensis]|uniref:3-dehydroquinate synthase n=1 Tax=Sinobaca qinghaiensis TaxID=342944 RepID=A0A419V328_9BACL|nr:3-dehydroquinate synthase [Sinobaca qinghaiensis]RKD72852.1 3-dehydroquinate synthase [Sinobaca qinghaiensis]